MEMLTWELVMQLSKVGEGRRWGCKLRSREHRGYWSHTIPGGGCVERRGSMVEPLQTEAMRQHFKVWGTRRHWQRRDQGAGGESGKRSALERELRGKGFAEGSDTLSWESTGTGQSRWPWQSGFSVVMGNKAPAGRGLERSGRESVQEGIRIILVWVMQ